MPALLPAPDVLPPTTHPLGIRPACALSTDRIAAEVGPPEVLVNTIGAFGPGDALSTTPETLRLMIDVNWDPRCG